METDRHDAGKGYKHIGLYKLALDGSANWERITWFNREDIYKASNPVVSNDGQHTAFQVPKVAQVAGVGQGVYILDLEAAGLRD